ncbi:hypothetical protein COHA_007922 [Chlorella ohadii]|uniref:Prolyl 4-hydroxylase alpha subunit domain-containing protein n=1 Tax=Chlorella ohadii TaxID=2649997 RepID=A0AAD5GZI1_9CHLO|nr:hypothetical protein COHA_007922 [Chlorella ohadii]
MAAQGDWAEAFEAERQGLLRGAAGPITPQLVLDELRRAQESEQSLRQQLAALQARTAGLQAQVCASQAENLQLRGALHVAKQAAEPSVVQLRQLLLDPAVNREFAGLRAELEGRTRELALAQAAVRFGGHGEPLLDKLDKLQDDNADLRRQVGESRAQQLERSLAAAREQLEDLRRVNGELEQHAFSLDQQAEAFAEQALLSKRGQGPRNVPAGPATPQPWTERAGKGVGGKAQPWSRPSTLGSLDVAENGMLTWTLPAAHRRQALGAEGSDGNVAAGTAVAASMSAAAASPTFAIPPPALPASCRGLLERHEWCLVCETAAPDQLAVQLRWLGGPSFPGTDGMSVCAEILLSVRCGQAASDDTAIGGGRSRSAACAEAHQWLQHAFNLDQPSAGIPADLCADAAADGGELAGLEVEVQLQFEGLALHLQAPLPALVVHESPMVLKVSEDPVLLLVDGFLSPQECEAVRALGAPHLKRSKVSAGDETPLRTSSSMFITGALMQHPMSLHLDARVTQLTERYALHLDNRAGDCAKRAATCMVYLSDLEAGGATSFPRSTGFSLHKALEACAAGYQNEPAPPDSPAVVHSLRAKQQRPEGLRVFPKEGRAVIFWSRLPSGEEDKCSIHEAERVGAGVKWIATRWCREDP